MAKQNTMGETFQELRELLVAYAKQEIRDPLKKLTRYLGVGIPGALILVLGVYLLSLGIMRGLQHISWTSTGFGSLVPYAGATFFLLLVAVLCGLKAKSSITAGDDGSKGKTS